MKPKSSGEDRWRDLHVAYADALWTWASVETEIFAVYVAAIGALKTDMRPIRAAFFAINSFEMRLTMTHAAVKERWDAKSAHRETWTKLEERCKTAARERGSIAHLAGHKVDPQKPHQKILYVLLDPHWHHRHPATWGEAKSKGVDFAKLTKFSYDWHKVYYDLSQFANQIWGEALLPASSEPPTGSHHLARSKGPQRSPRK